MKVLATGSFKVEGGKVKGKLHPQIDFNGMVTMYGLMGIIRKKKDEKTGWVNWTVLAP